MTPGQAAAETAAWAAAELEHLLGVPEYGSPAWLQMEPTDPRVQAALIAAAENWRRHQNGEDR